MLIDFFRRGEPTRRDAEPVVRRVISEEDFKGWLSSTYRVAVTRYSAGDIRGTLRVLERYYAMREIADEDPLLSLLESGTVAIITVLALKEVDDMHFARAFELLEMAVDVLDTKFARYQASGDRPPPDSMFWCGIVGTLGDAKWKAPEEYRDAVLTMHQMIYRYYKAESTLRRNLIMLPQSASQKRSIFHNFRWHALGVIRAVMRHNPDRLIEIQERVVDFHGPDYFFESNPFIFGMAITEEYIKPETNLTRINRLYDEFVRLAVNLRPDAPHDAFLEASKKERHMISQVSKQRFQLLEG